MSSKNFSYTNMDARKVASIAVKEISISREKYHAERKDYIDHHYYRKYVRWCNFFNLIKRFFGLRQNILADSETYYREFNSRAVPINDMITLMVIGAEHDFRIQALSEILSLADAAIHNDCMVKLSAEHCRVLGYGHGLVPITSEEQERRKAESELEDVIHQNG